MLDCGLILLLWQCCTAPVDYYSESSVGHQVNDLKLPYPVDLVDPI